MLANFEGIELATDNQVDSIQHEFSHSKTILFILQFNNFWLKTNSCIANELLTKIFSVAGL